MTALQTTVAHLKHLCNCFRYTLSLQENRKNTEKPPDQFNLVFLPYSSL